MVSGTTRTSVASRLLALLGAFDSEHRSLTLSELARRADLPLTTAYRLIGELVDGGVLVRRPSGHYVVGRRLWDLGLLAPGQAGLRQVASPFLHDIYGATLATVHVAVREAPTCSTSTACPDTPQCRWSARSGHDFRCTPPGRQNTPCLRLSSAARVWV